jgi:branched-chain amino acid transport system ATP-binding protein
LLELRGLAARYGDVPAIWDVSLTVGAGEVVALIGPNGAGKTTLLRAIAGLHRPAAGGIYLEGQPIHALPPHAIVERGVLLVPEGRRLFGGLTAGENLAVGAHAPRARAAHAETLETVFEIFPILRERRGQLASALSGGQQQMLAIGRALMGRPRLLLLDEPSLGLASRASVLEAGRVVGAGASAELLADEGVRRAYLGYTAASSRPAR